MVLLSVIFCLDFFHKIILKVDIVMEIRNFPLLFGDISECQMCSEASTFNK